VPLEKLTPRQEQELLEREEDRLDERDRQLARRDRVGEMPPAGVAAFGGGS
jgi:hypothetical protein